MKGGVGKTTLAVNVAHYLSNISNKKVALIDIDPQFNATQCLFTAQEYVELLKKDKDTILTIFDTEIRPTATAVSGTGVSKPKEFKDIKLQQQHGIGVLVGSIDLYRVEMKAGEGREFILKRFIKECLQPQGYEFIIIDTPPTPSIWMTSALIASQYYVIPVKPDPLSMIGIDLLEVVIELKRKNFDLDIKCLGVVFTMVERNDSVIFRDAKKSLKSNSRWKDLVFNKHLLKRAFVAKDQLTKPFIYQHEDYELRKSLKGIVDQIIETTNETKK